MDNSPLESQPKSSQTDESAKKDFVADIFLVSLKSATKSFLESASGDSKNPLDIDFEKAFKLAGSIFGEMIKYKDTPLICPQPSCLFILNH